MTLLFVPRLMKPLQSMMNTSRTRVAKAKAMRALIQRRTRRRKRRLKCPFATYNPKQLVPHPGLLISYMNPLLMKVLHIR
jgi:hypothetical protein